MQTTHSVVFIRCVEFSSIDVLVHGFSSGGAEGRSSLGADGMIIDSFIEFNFFSAK